MLAQSAVSEVGVHSNEEPKTGVPTNATDKTTAIALHLKAAVEVVRRIVPYLAFLG
jgi:hypothetical protein